MTRVIRVTALAEVPRTPSFIRLRGEEMAAVPIEDLSDEELRKVGELWTEDLVERAQERRKP
ncbi:MAG: hypothetical protein KAJ42_10340 [Gemmatimonadetes bacterium]|nr:hypothetical protein [Gemmatimonadota bacterium]